MSRRPKSNIRRLCGTLQNDRSVIRVCVRRLTFLQIEIKDADREIDRFGDISLQSALESN
jgi:hypothetical protein